MATVQYVTTARNRKFFVTRYMTVGFLAGALMILPVANMVGISASNVSRQQGRERLHPDSSTRSIYAPAGLREVSQAEIALNSSPQNKASIWAPYWKLGGGFESTLLINNVKNRPIALQPIVYTAAGELLAATPVSLEKLESKQISLREIIKAQKGEGQIGFSFEGMSMDVVAQIVIANEAMHISFNHVFMAAMGHTSQFEGVFYFPEVATSVNVALANIGEQPLKAKLILSGGAADLNNMSVRLAPHETRTVNALPDRVHQLESPNAMGISIKHSGAPGALVALGMVSTLSGHSTNIRLVDPGSLKSDRLVSPIAALQGASATVVARNVGQEAVKVKLEVHYTLEGDNRKLSLTPHSIAPQDSSAFDITQELSSLPETAANIALDLISSRPASLVADLLLLDGSFVKAVQATPMDADGESAPAYDYPWQVGPKVDTIISLTNPSQSDDLKYSLFIFYGEGRVYSYREHVLRPGEARQIAVRDLITNKIPDDLGTVLPADATFGQAKARVQGVLQKDVRLLGEAIIIDAAKRVAATLSCPDCPPDPSGLVPTLSSVAGQVGESVYVNWACYFSDNTFVVNPTPLSVLTDDLSVAEYSLGFYRVQFNGVGETTLWGYDEECGWSNDGETCHCDVPITLIASITVTVFRLKIHVAGSSIHFEDSDSGASIVAGEGFAIIAEAINAVGDILPNINVTVSTSASRTLGSTEIGLPSSFNIVNGSYNSPGVVLNRVNGTDRGTSYRFSTAAGGFKDFFLYTYFRVVSTREGQLPNPTQCGYTIQPNDHLVALPVRDLCDVQVVVRNPTTGQSDTAPKKDAGPHFPGGNCDPSGITVDPYWNTGTRPKVESLTCESGNNNAGIDLGDGTYATVGSPSQVVWRWQ